MNNRNVQAIAFSIVIGGLCVAFLFSGGSSNSDNPDCLAPKGCTLYINEADQVHLKDSGGNTFDVTKVTIRLTQDQAKVLGDPNGVLVKARSFLVTFADVSHDCLSNETKVNGYVTTVLVARDTWQKVATGNGPISICE